MDIILMGDANAGRSSIAKIIFQKIGSKATMMLGETNKMETTEFKIQKIDFKVYDFPNKYDLEDPAPSEQMILKNAAALIYVLNPGGDTYKSLEIFAEVYEYLKKKNTNSCQFFIFINKSDIDLGTQEARDEFMIKHKKKLTDEEVDVKQVNLYFTTIIDYSIYEAFSKVIQKILPCTTYVSKLLNKLCDYCKIEKAFVFDICSKLFIAHNDKVNIEPVKYEICCEMIDIHIDISLLYNNEKKEENSDEPDKESMSCVKLNVETSEDKREFFILQELEDYLCLGFTVKESNFDRPYLIEANINKFKEGLVRLLSDTTKSLS